MHGMPRGDASIYFNMVDDQYLDQIPVLGTIAFISGFLVARDDTDGEAGNVARNAGTFAIDTGSTIGQAAKEVNEKHGILDTIKGAWANLKKYDEEKELSKKTMETASQVKDKTMEFEQKHHVMENILQSLQKFSTNMLEKLQMGKNDTEAAPADSAENQAKEFREESWSHLFGIMICTLRGGRGRIQQYGVGVCR